MHENAEHAYNKIAIFMHWIAALLFMAALGLGVYFWTLVEGIPADSKSFFALIPWHKTFGFTVFLLLLLRLPWRMMHPPPAMPDTMKPWEKRVAHLVHWALYGIMVGIPLSGWLGSAAGNYTFDYLGFIEMPEFAVKDTELAEFIYDYIHVPLAWGGAGLFIAHVGAALKHHFVDRDNILVRMVPVLKRRPDHA